MSVIYLIQIAIYFLVGIILVGASGVALAEEDKGNFRFLFSFGFLFTLLSLILVRVGSL